jgi:hypothetical protein
VCLLGTSFTGAASEYLVSVDIKSSSYQWNTRPSVVDPDSPGSAFFWPSWIRVRIGNADPDPDAWKLTKTFQVL